jgi:hypothetical protein
LKDIVLLLRNGKCKITNEKSINKNLTDKVKYVLMPVEDEPYGVFTVLDPDSIVKDFESATIEYTLAVRDYFYDSCRPYDHYTELEDSTMRVKIDNIVDLYSNIHSLERINYEGIILNSDTLDSVMALDVSSFYITVKAQGKIIFNYSYDVTKNDNNKYLFGDGALSVTKILSDLNSIYYNVTNHFDYNCMIYIDPYELIWEINPIKYKQYPLVGEKLSDSSTFFFTHANVIKKLKTLNFMNIYVCAYDPSRESVSNLISDTFNEYVRSVGTEEFDLSFRIDFSYGNEILDEVYYHYHFHFGDFRDIVDALINLKSILAYTYILFKNKFDITNGSGSKGSDTEFVVILVLDSVNVMKSIQFELNLNSKNYIKTLLKNLRKFGAL